MIDNHDILLEQILRQLQNELKQKKPSLLIISESFKALSDFLENFATGATDDASQRIYECLVDGINPNNYSKTFPNRGTFVCVDMWYIIL